ncbi:MAG TPA: Spx/MgsR family RNA polymerase-binding regulatory protein [Luteibacter sp.]|jgi:Spx/MgsR family transcriptional regulator|nr:Spx/MgsR family RNA polymerase-binding regulatory protein [Luteibacter sp.]
MADVTLYGLSNCDTCKKARNWLTRFNIDHDFVDYRANPASPDTLRVWATAVGGWDKLVNRASTTWRNLLPQRKNPASDPEWSLLIRDNPTLVKRPVVVFADGAVSVGFTDNGFKKLFNT